MACVLSRAVIVLLGWGATYWLLTALSPHLTPAIIYLSGIAWVLAGIVLFGYLYMLRRGLGLLPNSPRCAASAIRAERFL
jgi:hypothetical protein